MDASMLCGDDSFGPGVKSVDCRGGFDFTGQYDVPEMMIHAEVWVVASFEEAILAILPTACFIIVTPFRTLHLFRGRLRVRKNALHVFKLVRHRSDTDEGEV